MYRLALLFIAVALAAQAPQPPSPFATANAVVAAWIEWKPLYEHLVETGGQVLDLQEKRAFDRLNDRFSELRKQHKLQYQ